MDEYKFGGHKRTSINICRLLSELEGSYTLLKYLGFEDDMNIMDDMKKKYYKIYFQLHKEEKINRTQHTL